MKGEDIFNAVTDARDDQIEAAKSPPKRKHRRALWISAVAAALAAAVGIGAVFGGGLSTSAYAIAEANYPKQPKYSTRDSQWEKWTARRIERRDLAETYDGALTGFLTKAVPELLSGAGDGNAVASPLNVYMALSMLAEVTGGGTRGQILALLGAENIEVSRQRARALWDVNYIDDGTVTSLLANSVWLSEGMEYEKSVLDTLAEDYRASSFRGEMGSEGYSKALREWLDENTGKMLSNEIKGLGFSPDTVLALASTVYYRARWSDEFSKSASTEGPFHAPGGDVTATYMHESHLGTRLCRGEGFTAILKSFRYGGDMWFILPDEGVSIDELLQGPDLPAFLASPISWEGWESRTVNLTVPKFDVTGDLDLTDALTALGVTDAFDLDTADFSPMLGDAPAYVSSVRHAARVVIDEEGVVAAAFTLGDNAGDAPSQEIIDFTLDRPFLFALTGDDGLPLFAGAVNRP